MDRLALKAGHDIIAFPLGCDAIAPKAASRPSTLLHA
jgi:hypothetical protein